ncbi:unnamed protein product [Gongylonema pulchrum]|uniref:GDT1 family protein n=1 Tax=Gongylonema pulchrum TaxID=637853 RepID=A0A183E7C7_9BILA|nr:unnamed protein product [Gongylonema pulchrum]
MGLSGFFTRFGATAGIMVVFAGISLVALHLLLNTWNFPRKFFSPLFLGAYKLKKSSDSLQFKGTAWKAQEMEDFLHCKEENMKIDSQPPPMLASR